MKPLVVAIIVFLAMDCALLYMNAGLRRDIRGLTSSDHANSSSAEVVQDKPETVLEPRDDQSSEKKTSRKTASHHRRKPSMAEVAIEALIQRAVAEGVEAAKAGRDEYHDFLQKTRPSTKQLFEMVRQENNRLAAIYNEKWTPGYMDKKETPPKAAHKNEKSALDEKWIKHWEERRTHTNETQIRFLSYGTCHLKQLITIPSNCGILKITSPVSFQS